MTEKMCKKCKETKITEEFPLHGGLLCRKCKSRQTTEQRSSGNWVPPIGFVERRILSGMKSRCYNKKEDNYQYYGGKEENPTSICDRWLESSDNFIEDMGYRPSPNHSIERKDPNGSYEPSNCEWKLKKLQARNKTNNVLLEINGEKIVAAEASEKYGLKESTISARNRRGSNVDKSGSNLIAPLRQADLYEYQGRNYKIQELADMVGVKHGTMHYRLKVVGKTVEEALTQSKDNRGSYKRSKPVE
jgi:hypothetical protein